MERQADTSVVEIIVTPTMIDAGATVLEPLWPEDRVSEERLRDVVERILVAVSDVYEAKIPNAPIQVADVVK